MITICLVAYSKKITETVAFQSLLSLKKEVVQQLNLVVFDNGDVNYQLNSDKYHFNQFSYYFNKDQERGTRIAYQHCLDTTLDNWIMLLDDDTALTEKYVVQVFNEIDDKDTKFVAYMPIMRSANHTQISPTQSYQIKTLNYPIEPGIYSENITGISSGLVLRTEFLRDIGGFNPMFPLDYLDHWLFYEIVFRKKKVGVIDSAIVHQLSVMNLQTVSERRYKSIFNSEYQYYKYYNSRLLHELRSIYIKRVIKGLIFRKKEFRWWIFLKILLNDRGGK